MLAHRLQRWANTKPTLGIMIYVTALFIGFVSILLHAAAAIYIEGGENNNLYHLIHLHFYFAANYRGVTP